jgi:hypothetical protein
MNAETGHPAGLLLFGKKQWRRRACLRQRGACGKLKLGSWAGERACPSGGRGRERGKVEGHGGAAVSAVVAAYKGQAGRGRQRWVVRAGQARRPL